MFSKMEREAKNIKPSWIILGPKESLKKQTQERLIDIWTLISRLPYVRTLDIQIRDWQKNRDEDAGEAGDTDSNNHMMLS